VSTAQRRLPRALEPLGAPACRWLAGALVCSLSAAGLWTLAVVWQVIDLGGGTAKPALTTETAAGPGRARALTGAGGAG